MQPNTIQEIVTEIEGYKLFRKMADGSLAPLFINKRLRVQPNVWYEAEDHPTKGFAHRPGWHAALKPEAPHLSLKGRVWCRVKLRRARKFNRPESQGGTWVLAESLMVLEELP